LTRLIIRQGTSYGQGTGGITVNPQRGTARTARPPKPRSPAVRDVGTPQYGAAQPSTPVAPATPPVGTVYGQPQPQPFDTTYENQTALNRRNLDQTGVDLDQQQSGLRRAYGFDDASDPFSRMALLRQAYENRARGAGNAMAARGQLYSGAYQNAQDQTALGFEQDTDATRKAYNEALLLVARKRAGALSDYEQANINAGAAALDRASQIRPEAATLGTVPKTPVAAIANPPPPAQPSYTVKGGVSTVTGSTGRNPKAPRGQPRVTGRTGQGSGSITVGPRSGPRKKRGKRSRGRTVTITGSFGGAQGSTR
jgi:hypothetical protein